MAGRLEFDEEARVDFDQAFDWYAKRSPIAAIGFVAEVDAAIEKIAADPQRFGKTYAGCRQCRLKRYPFSVIYHCSLGAISEDCQIVIVAIAHAKRRPGYWRSRQ